MCIADRWEKATSNYGNLRTVSPKRARTLKKKGVYVWWCTTRESFCWRMERGV